jgi:uncharacterized protein
MSDPKNPVTVDDSELRPLPRAANGRDYLLYVATPASYAAEPTRRYPVVYVLDGYWDFHLVVAVRGLLVFDELAPEFLVVGIGYQGSDLDLPALRRLDLKLEQRAFLAVLAEEVVPAVDAAYRTDPTARVLAGGSGGADVVLEALFSGRHEFDAFVAVAPGDRGCLARELELAASPPARPLRLHTSRGGQESPPSIDLSERLHRQLELHRTPGLAFAYARFDDAHHATVKLQGYAHGLVHALARPDAVAAAEAPSPSVTSAPAYRFTTDHSVAREPLIAQLVAPWVGAAGVLYLEVGVFEGRSLLWMMEHVLTHPSSHAVAIDPMYGSYRTTLEDNVAASGLADRIYLLRGTARGELPRLPASTFDLVLLDASHVASEVLYEMTMAWSLLKPGGLLVVADYAHAPDAPRELRPREAADAFVVANWRDLEVVHLGYQLVLRKRVPLLDRPEVGKHGNRQQCSPLGPHLYYWDRREVVLLPAGVSVRVDDALTAAIEDLLAAMSPSELGPLARATEDHAPRLRAILDRLPLAESVPSTDGLH